MTNQTTPHYLLLSDSKPTSGQIGEGGRWQFQLESLDGTALFRAADEESEMSGERLELLAVVRGLEALDQPSAVTLVTNSKYVTHGIRYGLAGWREAGWQWENFGRMSAVANADLWQRVGRALEIHDVRCRHLSAARAWSPSTQRNAATDRSSVWRNVLQSLISGLSTALRVVRWAVPQPNPAYFAH